MPNANNAACQRLMKTVTRSGATGPQEALLWPWPETDRRVAEIGCP